MKHKVVKTQFYMVDTEYVVEVSSNLTREQLVELVVSDKPEVTFIDKTCSPHVSPMWYIGPADKRMNT